jgi:hypothetical protein
MCIGCGIRMRLSSLKELGSCAAKTSMSVVNARSTSYNYFQPLSKAYANLLTRARN